MGVFNAGIPEEAIGAINDRLEQDEELLAVMNWKIKNLINNTTTGSATLGITSVNLYSFGFKNKVFKGTSELVAAGAHPLSRLGSITDSEKTPILEGAQLHLGLQWDDGRQDHVFATEVAWGKEFVSILRNATKAARNPGSKGGDDLVDRLARLADLHTAGALTDQEFADAKQKLISG